LINVCHIFQNSKDKKRAHRGAQSACKNKAGYPISSSSSSKES
jgi:hypothetical protein